MRSSRTFRAALARATCAVLFAASILLAGAMVSPDAALATPAEEQQFVDLLNDYRAGEGLGPLESLPFLADLSRAHTQWMVDNDDLQHAADIAEGLTPGTWGGVAENIGFASVRADTVGALHLGFVNSPGHEANMTGPAFDGVGVGVITSGNTMWVTFRFIDRFAVPTPVLNPPTTSTTAVPTTTTTTAAPTTTTAAPTTTTTAPTTTAPSTTTTAPTTSTTTSPPTTATTSSVATSSTTAIVTVPTTQRAASSTSSKKSGSSTTKPEAEVAGPLGGDQVESSSVARPPSVNLGAAAEGEQDSEGGQGLESEQGVEGDAGNVPSTTTPDEVPVDELPFGVEDDNGGGNALVAMAIAAAVAACAGSAVLIARSQGS